MAQPDGLSHRSGSPQASPASDRPDYPELPPPPSVALPPARTDAGAQRTGFRRDRSGWLLSAGSAALSFLAAAALFRSGGIALALLALIFVHEMGHLVVLKLLRIPVSAPIFIPLIGAFVVSGQIHRARDAAIVALAGPFAGGMGALACLVIARRLGVVACLAPSLSDTQPYTSCFSYAAGPGYGWLVLANVGFIFNLINLLPLFPLDGGHVAATISRWFWPLGILISVALVLMNPNPITGILVLLAIALTLWAFWQPEPLTFLPAPFGTRVGITAAYVGVALLLAVGMLLTRDALQIARVAPFMFRP
ncbi:MAG: site-2 protease family protein [Ktedonobacterales bacterium]